MRYKFIDACKMKFNIGIIDLCLAQSLVTIYVNNKILNEDNSDNKGCISFTIPYSKLCDLKE